MGNQIAPGIYATTVPIYVIFYLSFLATLCQEMSFCLSCGEIDVKMRCVFGPRSTVLAFPNKMASKRWPCGAESTAKMIFQNDFFGVKLVKI